MPRGVKKERPADAGLVISENERAYRVKAEFPGARREDIAVVHEKAVARFEDGVLELTLPKNGATPPPTRVSGK